DGYTSQVILRAEREIRITSPYFMPPVELLQALRCAASGGVRIRVMIPTVSDSRLLDLVAESYIDDLLAAGVELYRYEEGFLHAKFLIVDDRLAAVGTANMDYRSLELNEEVTAFLYDRQLIQRLTHTFERDLKSCHPVSAANWHPQWWRRRTGELLRLGAPLF
ncbi:MAG: cardiolipin synthase, partial [Alistipes sp.]